MGSSLALSQIFLLAKVEGRSKDSLIWVFQFLAKTKRFVIVKCHFGIFRHYAT